MKKIDNDDELRVYIDNKPLSWYIDNEDDYYDSRLFSEVMWEEPVKVNIIIKSERNENK